MRIMITLSLALLLCPPLWAQRPSSGRNDASKIDQLLERMERLEKRLNDLETSRDPRRRDANPPRYAVPQLPQPDRRVLPPSQLLPQPPQGNRPPQATPPNSTPRRMMPPNRNPSDRNPAQPHPPGINPPSINPPSINPPSLNSPFRSPYQQAPPSRSYQDAPPSYVPPTARPPQSGPVQDMPRNPFSSPVPNESTPKGWQRFEFNGQYYYIIPVEQAHQMNQWKA